MSNLSLKSNLFGILLLLVIFYAYLHVSSRRHDFNIDLKAYFNKIENNTKIKPFYFDIFNQKYSIKKIIFNWRSFEIPSQI